MGTPGAAGGDHNAGSRRGEAAVPDPVVSNSAVSGPVVSSSADVAHPTVSSKRSADDGKKKKRKMNRAEAATATNKKKSKATSERDLR